MMRIDIDIGDPLQAIVLAQVFDRNAAIVKHAESRCVTPAGVMQPRDRHKGAI